MNCHFCNLKLKYLVTYDARYFIRSNKYLENNNKFNLWIDDLNKNSCVSCGINYMKFKYSDNKLKKLMDRNINGGTKFSKKIDPNKLNIREYCVFCKKHIKNLTYFDSIHTRENYIEGIGQLCDKCILVINNFN